MDGNFFFSIFRSSFYSFIFSVWYSVLIIVAILVYFVVNNDTTQWEPVLNSLCPDLIRYRKFNDDGLFNMLVLFGLIGAHYGIHFLSYLTHIRYSGKQEKINNWNITGLVNNIYKILLLILFGFPIIPVFVVPATASIAVIFIFKSSLAYLFSLFNIFGPFIFCFLILKLGNPAIYNPGFSDLKYISEDIERNNYIFTTIEILNTNV